MPSTRSRANDDEGDISRFNEWALQEIKRREISQKDYQKRIIDIMNENNGSIPQANLDQVRQWIEESPLKPKKGKAVAEAQGSTSQTAETVSANKLTKAKTQKSLVVETIPSKKQTTAKTQKTQTAGTVRANKQTSTESQKPQRGFNTADEFYKVVSEMYNEVQPTKNSVSNEQPRQESLESHGDQDLDPERSAFFRQLLENFQQAQQQRGGDTTMTDVISNPKPIQELDDVQRIKQLLKQQSAQKNMGKKDVPNKITKVLPFKKAGNGKKQGPTTDTQLPQPVKVEAQDDTMVDLLEDSRGYRARSPRPSPMAIEATTKTVLNPDEVNEVEYFGNEIQPVVMEDQANEEYEEQSDEQAGVGQSREGRGEVEEGEREGKDEEEREEEEEEEDQEEEGGEERSWMMPAASCPPNDTDIAAMLAKYPIRFPKPVVASKTPRFFRYHDYVTGDWVIAEIHCLTKRGALQISFPGRNKAYPNVRAGALVKGSLYRQAKQDFEGSGGQKAVNRIPDDFQHYSLDQFIPYVLCPGRDKPRSGRYPETRLLGRFEPENFTSNIIRSDFSFVYGEEEAEYLYAKLRERDGTPHPAKAYDMGWVTRPKRKRTNA